MHGTRPDAHGLAYETHPDVYEPSDDTWLLIDALDVAAGEWFVEVGCGAGLVSVAAARQGARVLALDVNPHALRLSRKNARLNHVDLQVSQGDLVTAVRTERARTIAFNPPYLPTAPEERLAGPLDRAFDGGPTGRTVVERFVSQLGRAPSTDALLVASSLQDLDALERLFAAHGLRHERVRTKPFSFESLLVYRLTADTD